MAKSREDIRMSQHDETRRAFLKGAAVGAGAIAGGGLAPEAFAKEPNDAKEQVKRRPAAADPAETPAHQHMSGEGHGAFFNDEDAATILAFTERLMPGAPGMPGARGAD